MERWLIHPPFADPTQPYLSLPTLKGYLRAHGLDARVIDLNVEGAHWLFRDEQVRRMAKRVERRFRELDARPALAFEEQREYRILFEARGRIERTVARETNPLDTMRDPVAFHEPESYLRARQAIEDVLAITSATTYPYTFDWNRASHGVLPWSFDLLDAYVSEKRSPLAAYYDELLDGPTSWDDFDETSLFLPADDVEFVGISIVFPSQIPDALAFARAIRERAPHAFLAFGGPCIHQVVFHQGDAIRARLFAYADGIGLFEGEQTLVALLPRLEAWRTATPGERLELLADVPNLLTYDERSGTTHLGPRYVLDLRDAPLPDYSDLDLDRYVAPSRTLLYAPTRGCYWNQCSFCYYGLSESATAKYREVPAAKAASDLAILSQRHGVKNVYLSCDVLSPRYALQLADALIERQTKVRWSCDMKIEAYFDEERCARLYESGLRAVAFGIESGSDRILAAMRKGCDRETMTRVNRSFHAAGIATQWMTFTGHPGETLDEALSTVSWIDEEWEDVDLFIVGEFGLEAGAHVAQEPERYGVTKIYYAEGDELQLYALYQQSARSLTPREKERLEERIDEVAAAYALAPYPWAGAVSTHHSFLQILRHGQGVFTDAFQKARIHVARTAGADTSGRGRTRFAIDAIEENERRFFQGYLQKALYTTIPGHRDGAVTDVAALSAAHYARAIAELDELPPRRR